MTSAIETLSHRLLPWLAAPFAQLDAARRAGTLGHAWLISGPAGVGKLNLGLALAHQLLGDHAPPAPLGAETALEAAAARYEQANRHPDLHWLHPEEDKATISVDQIRDLIDSFALTALRGGAKVALIEPAEALTPAAANALLKTLEEPTSGGYLLLLSQQPGRLPATVRSRCQQVALRAPSVEVMAEWLAVGVPAVVEAQGLVGSAPLPLAAALLRGDHSIFKELESELHDVSNDRLDPQVVAQSWVKGDTALALDWLRRRLHAELTARLAGRHGSTEVTVPVAAALHNAWQTLSERALFDAYDRAETLLNQLGSGLNIELALTAMLNGLIPNRGR